MSNDVVEELERYKEQTKTDGENLVRAVFPQRVHELRELLNSKLFSFEAADIFQKVNLPVPAAELPEANGGNGTALGAAAGKPDGDGKGHQQRPPCGTPVFTFPGGSVPHNGHIKAMIEATKPRLTKLMMEAQLVRLWIQFNVPRIEDGNNFGVGIQEEVLSEVSAIERDALAFLEQFTRYYASRGKLVAKTAKFPHIDDYRECIRDMDEKQAISVRYAIMECRNHYAGLHDLIVKNIDRIKVPRSNNTMSMY